MDLTIIIVNHNSLKVINELVPTIKSSLLASSINYEITIVDNASNPSEQNSLRKLEVANIILNNQNKGFGTACNQGINYAKGKYILLLNPDILVLGKSIPRLVSSLKRIPNSFLGGLLLNTDLSVQPSCGLFPGLSTVLKALFFKGEKLGLTKFTPKESSKVEWCSGACLGGEKTSFIKVGGFDENRFLYMEDVDFLYRAQKKGFNCYFEKKAEFIHHGAYISGKNSSVVNTMEGILFFCKKHAVKFTELIKLLLRLKVILGIIFWSILLNKKRLADYTNAYKIIS